MDSSIYRQKLMKDSDASTFQRSVFGQYLPGSTFKPIALLGALKTNPAISKGNMNAKLVIAMRVDAKCVAGFTLGSAHGSIGIREAIMRSCNIFIYEVAQEIGYKPIHEMAKQFELASMQAYSQD